MDTSQHFRGRHALYKAGTAELAQWLTTNATSCSTACAKARAGNDMTTSELLRLATAIAESSVAIPAYILEVFREVIASRQHCADWYASQSSSSLEESNRSHRYFITTLQRAHDVLNATRKAQKVEFANRKRVSARSTGQREAEPELDLYCRATQLEVEESSESSPVVEPNQHPEKDELLHLTTSSLTLEVSDSGDKVHEIWCLLEDLDDLRRHLQVTWNDYASGALSFFAASTITDCAFTMMRQADREFVAQNPKLRDMKAILETLDLTCQDINGATYIVKTGSSPKAGADELVNDLLCPLVLANRTLCAVEETWQACKDVQAHKQPAQQQILWPDHLFSDALLRTLYAITMVITSGPHQKLERRHDEFVDAFWDHYQENERRICHVVACSVYMNIYDVIQEKADVGVLEFTKAMQQTRASIDALREYHTGHQSASGRIIDLLDEALAPDFSAEEFLLADRETFSTTIFRSLPITMGDRIFDHRMVVHMLSMKLMNDGTMLLAIAHLYRAGRHYSVGKEWKDMDWFIETHSHKHQLVLGIAPAANGGAVARHLDLALGISLSALVVSERSVKKSSIDVFHPNSRLVAQKHEQRQVVPGSPFIREHCAQIQGRATHRGLLPSVLASIQSADTRQQPVAGLQLLQNYREIIAAAEPQLNFDYIAFWVACSKVLDEIMSASLSLLPKASHTDVTSETELVRHLLKNVAVCCNIARPLDGKTAFGTAIQVLDQAVEGLGADFFTKSALMQSSGYQSDTTQSSAASRTSGYVGVEKAAASDVTRGGGGQ